MVKVSAQSPRGLGSPHGLLGAVRELYLGSFVLERMVIWIDERNADFSKVPRRSCLILKGRDGGGNLGFARVVCELADSATACSKWEAGGQCFSVLLDCTLENKLGMSLRH